MSVLSADRLKLCRAAPKNLSRSSIDYEHGLALEPAQCGEAFLFDSRIAGAFSAEFEFGDSYRRKKHRLRIGKPRDVSQSQGAPLDVDPDAGVDQESQGFLTPSPSFWPLSLVRRP